MINRCIGMIIITMIVHFKAFFVNGWENNLGKRFRPRLFYPLFSSFRCLYVRIIESIHFIVIIWFKRHENNRRQLFDAFIILKELTD